MMQAGTSTRLLVVIAACVIIIAGMREASAIIVPFLLSVFIAIISAPPLFWLQNRGLPRSLALLVVIAGILLAGSGLIALAGSSVDAFSQALPDYQQRLKAETSALFSWLTQRGLNIDQELRSHIDPAQLMGLAGNLLNGLGNMLANAFLIFLTVIFILMEASDFPAKLKAAVDDPQSSMARFNTIAGNINHYLAIKTWASLATGLIIGIWLAILGVDFPVLWGALAFLLNYVPNIGAIIAAIPAVLVALVQLGTGTALWAALAYLVVNNVIGNIIEPRFMGKRLDLSTLVVFLSLVFWGWVLGPVGMFLSVPLTMTAKIALEANESTHWLSIFLGNSSSSARSSN